MVTGPRFSMPATKSQFIPQKSIQVFLDGFCFYTPQQCEFITFKNFPTDTQGFLEQTFKKYFGDQPPSIIHFEHPALFVPQALFENSKKEDYYTHYNTLAEAFELNVLDTEDKTLKVVAPIASKWKSFFKKMHANIDIINYQNLLYNLVQSHSKTQTSKQLFVHLQKGAFDLFLFDGAKLLFNNRFAQNNVDTFLYFLFYVVETLKLDQDAFDLYFLGKYDSYNAYYDGVSNFHNNLQYLFVEEQKNTTPAPAPFFCSH